MSSYDLIVAGGGPAGCSASITAARSGAKVLLLERGRFPRHKVCGEFVSAESLQLLANLLTPEDRHFITDAPSIAKSRLFVDGAEVHATIKPAAASITRFDLDAALWRSCVAEGVDARQECPVAAVSGAGPFLVKTQEHEFSGKALINAAGRWSNVTGARPRKNGRGSIGVKAHFVEPQASASVDLYFFEGGYCGVQPVSAYDGRPAVNACAMVRADTATTMPEVLGLHPKLRERSKAWQPLRSPVSTSPLIFHDPEPLNAGMLQVGDAAVFVDPFIGDGISLALHSGALASQCLCNFFRGDWDLEAASSEYSHRYRRRVLPVFRTSSLMRRFLRWPRVVRGPVLALLEKSPRLASQLVTLTR